MQAQGSINGTIVEELYERALVLADEVRAVFQSRASEALEESTDAMRLALSIEGLRTTTRVMHVLAWLLNQRAFLSGELSELQIRRHGALAEERPSDPEQLAQLLPETRELVLESEELYDRVSRLDRDWREQDDEVEPAVLGMQDKIAAAFGRNG